MIFSFLSMARSKPDLPISFEGKRVLIFDREGISTQLKPHLINSKIEILAAENHDIALKTAQSTTPDLIFLSNLDAFKVKAWRKWDSLKKAPAIVVGDEPWSGTLKRLRQVLREQEIQEYIHTPLNPHHFQRILSKYLSPNP